MIVGFWTVVLKLFGPTQLYVAPVLEVAVRFSAVPEHIGELLVRIEVIGVESTVTTSVLESLHTRSGLV